MRLLTSHQAACQTASRRIEMRIVPLFAGQLTAEMLRQDFQPLFVRKSEMPFGKGNVFVLQGQFGQLQIGFQESAAVTHQVQQLIARDLKLSARSDFLDLFQIQISIDRTLGSHQDKAISP